MSVDKKSSETSASASGWSNPLRDKRDKRMPRIPGPCAVVIFGVTGDLARKKLMPAIYDLANRGLLPANFALVGFARRDWTDEDFGKLVVRRRQAARPHPVPPRGLGPAGRGNPLRTGHIRRREGRSSGWPRRLEKLDAERGTGGNHAFYLSIPPKAFQMVCEQLHKSGLARPQQGRWSRVVIEKPFGHDLASAQELNGTVNSVFPEESVFRIDHYLGKETVQNILALRFANELYEPIWNNNYVDSVQITMAEDIGLGGRGGYYDGVGAARDVIQNHLIQLMALTAMEEPVNFSPHELQAEKIKVLVGDQADGAAGRDDCARPVHRGLAGQREGARPARGRGLLEGLQDRDLRRDRPRDRHPALGRRAVLPAHRKAAGPQGHRDRVAVQACAAPAVRLHDDRRARQERAW